MNVKFETYHTDYLEITGNNSSSVSTDLLDVNLATSGIILSAGGLHTCTIGYTGSGASPNYLMNVYVDGIRVVTNLSVNLGTYSATNGDGVSFVGFSAQNGGAWEANYISYWDYNSSYDATLVPEPSGIVAMLVGLIGLAGILRKRE